MIAVRQIRIKKELWLSYVFQIRKQAGKYFFWRDAECFFLIKFTAAKNASSHLEKFVRTLAR
jgi:hypothetical protein